MVSRLALPAVVLAALALPVTADEGMWPYNNIPTQVLKQKYGWAPDAAWLDHVRLASVRFNNGGSGSFVSPTGLVLTNHHVGANCIQKISTPERDYVKTGYRARSAADEVKCPDLELNVLEGIEDVTTRVNADIKPGMTDAQVLEAQKAQEARLEKECNEKTGLRCDTITLYAGGEYDLYRYKKYTDVRLVVAPEFLIAFFGGDPDNFTYPRWDIDFAIFRIYENDKPVHPAHYLTWNSAGPKENELVLVSGNPGSTSRLDTLAQLEFQRDQYPLVIRFLSRRAKLLHEFSDKSPENARMAQRSLFGVENSLKADKGKLQALQDPKVIEKKQSEERELRGRVAADAKLAAYTDAWDAIAAAEKAHAARFQHDYIVAQALASSPQLTIARRIVRYVVEKEKPNEKRLEEYRESNRQSLEFALFSPAPIYPSLEKATIADSFKAMSEQLGAEDPFVEKVLAGKVAEERASELVDGTKLSDVATRQRLVEGGPAAVDQSNDPMIVLARATDPELREIRKWTEDNVESVEKTKGAEIAKALFAARGKNRYPDATFTLRLAWGLAKGYVENGKQIRYETTWGGMYAHSEEHGRKFPYELPERYWNAKPRVDPNVPVDLVATPDITGGNSGSPVINRKGELVGLIFDGNIESLGNDVVYTEDQARAVAVHPAAIITSLRKVYEGASAIADELEKPAGGETPARPAAAKKSKN